MCVDRARSWLSPRGAIWAWTSPASVSPSVNWVSTVTEDLQIHVTVLFFLAEDKLADPQGGLGHQD